MMERYTLPQKLLFIKTYYSTTRPHSFAVAVSKLREMLEPELVPTEDVLRELIQKFRTTGSIVNGPPRLPAQKPAAVRKIVSFWKACILCDNFRTGGINRDYITVDCL